MEESMCGDAGSGYPWRDIITGSGGSCSDKYRNRKSDENMCYLRYTLLDVYKRQIKAALKLAQRQMGQKSGQRMRS